MYDVTVRERETHGSRNIETGIIKLSSHFSRLEQQVAISRLGARKGITGWI